MREDFVIITKSVAKFFYIGENVTKAVGGVSLNIKKGEFVIIVGPSGCGKSTLLHLILGIIQPTKGVVLIDGKKIDQFGDEKKARYRCDTFGTLFQHTEWVRSLDVGLNVGLPLAIKGFSLGVQRAKARILLRKFGISHLEYHNPHQLSYGQQQMAGLCRALILDPPIIIADEPTGNVDPDHVVIVMDCLKTLEREQGKTVLMVTHNMNLLRYANRVIHLVNGKVVMDRKNIL
ncbi:MAG: hypothetical protein ACD_63C00051G0002 [uncultured bacterium]|nr:MAG: hypothetical protein ACD_63C00051G0002 [uncultured bacterium]